MQNDIIERINYLFELLDEPIDSMFKITAIINTKRKFKIKNNERIGDHLSEFMENKERGAVFTPPILSSYLIKNTVSERDVIYNPFLKILDPSAGSGNIIIPLFIYLKDIYISNLDKINNLNSLNLKEEDIDKHIIDNNLFTYDIDEFSRKILIIDLFFYSSYINKNNILLKDYLTCELTFKFDIILGNPPYVGHKTVTGEYGKILKLKYMNVYKDKGDISYCFFDKGKFDLLRGGKLSFITSRYFMESPSGAHLRKIIKDEFSVRKIVDFYGVRPFKGKGIDPVMIFMKKSLEQEEKIKVLRPYGNKKDKFTLGLTNEDKDALKIFYIKGNSLNVNGWSLIEDKSKKIIDKIFEKTYITLNNICDSHQGIITGLDKAFVLDSKTLKDKNIEEDLVRTWIKSSYINKFNISYRDNFLICTDSIHENKESYVNTLNHLLPYKEKLMGRRECVKGIRKWYELQWGRKEGNFKGEKIVFPYKASSNRFAIDKGSFHSADIYSITLKDNSPFTYDYLVSLLNTLTYEFYFKTFAKKLGEDMYEYYPNNLMKLSLPDMKIGETVDDNTLYKYFDFTLEEINIIEEMNI